MISYVDVVRRRLIVRPKRQLVGFIVVEMGMRKLEKDTMV